VPADVLAASLARVPWQPASAPDTVQTGPPSARGGTERLQAADVRPQAAAAAVSFASTGAPSTLAAAGAEPDGRKRGPGPLTVRIMRATAKSRIALWVLGVVALCLLATIAVLLRTLATEQRITVVAAPVAQIPPPPRATTTAATPPAPSDSVSKIAPLPTIEAPVARETPVMQTPPSVPRKKPEVTQTPPPKNAKSPLEMPLQ